MSITLMSAVWNLEIPSTEKFVLMYLSDRANDEGGSCFPSIATIAMKVSRSERAVQKALWWLKENGFCTATQSGGRTNAYTLDPRRICTPAESAPRRICTPGVQPLRPWGAVAAPNTSIYTSHTPDTREARFGSDDLPEDATEAQASETTPAAPAPPTPPKKARTTKTDTADVSHKPPPPGVSVEVWEDFKLHRKAKKAPITMTVMRSISEQARKADWTLEAALIETVTRGWQTFKADWVKPKGRDFYNHHDGDTPQWNGMA